MEPLPSGKVLMATLCLWKCTNPDWQFARNARIIHRKSKKDHFNPNISFLGLQFSASLTFEKKIGKMHIAIETVEKPQKCDFGASKRLILL